MWVLQTLVAALLLPGTPTRASSQQRVPASPRCEVAPEVAPKEKKILLPVFPEGRRQICISNQGPREVLTPFARR